MQLQTIRTKGESQAASNISDNCEKEEICKNLRVHGINTLKQIFLVKGK